MLQIVVVVFTCVDAMVCVPGRYDVLSCDGMSNGKYRASLWSYICWTGLDLRVGLKVNAQRFVAKWAYLSSQSPGHLVAPCQFHKSMIARAICKSVDSSD
jgi:hypothetical protein